MTEVKSLLFLSDNICQLFGFFLNVGQILNYRNYEVSKIRSDAELYIINVAFIFCTDLAREESYLNFSTFF